LENHYFLNKGFLDVDGQILANMGRISHLPGVIVQGRYDMICPPTSAWKLSELWPNAELRMVRNAGHAMSEPGISAELVRAMDRIAEMSK
jgi:proline iminopeptidase